MTRTVARPTAPHARLIPLPRACSRAQRLILPKAFCGVHSDTFAGPSRVHQSIVVAPTPVCKAFSASGRPRLNFFSDSGRCSRLVDSMQLQLTIPLTALCTVPPCRATSEPISRTIRVGPPRLPLSYRCCATVHLRRSL